MQTELCKLAKKYGTDKAGLFTPVYDLLLRDRREQVGNVLEIGVGTPEAMKHVPGYQPGASLKMWKHYFPNADVWGIDIVTNGWSSVFQVDQGNPAQLKAFAEKYGPFDLVVDDGSHKPHHQIIGVQTLVPYLKPGGLYIVEDVNNFVEIEQGLSYPTICISYPHTGKHAARCMVIRG